VARDKQAEWLKLPALASHLFDSIRDQKASLLSISYNKLKHGPQFIVADPIVSATRRGHSPEQSDREFMNHCYVRVLHQGARTQEEDREFQGGRRAAPFLVGKPEILRKLLFGTMVFTANGMFILTDWKFRRLSGRHLELPGDPLWKSMIEEGARRLENVTPAF
jgi:hypothetical protein